MTRQKEIVAALLDKHAEKARESEYDRSVAIIAISAARKVIMAVPAHPNDNEYRTALLSGLHDLVANYHDPDGVFTSGKGVVGALVDDIHIALDDHRRAAASAG